MYKPGNYTFSQKQVTPVSTVTTMMQDSFMLVYEKLDGINNLVRMYAAIILLVAGFECSLYNNDMYLEVGVVGAILRKSGV